MKEYQIWKTIQVGTHKDNASLFNGLDDDYSNFIISMDLKKIMDIIPVSTTISEFDLVKIPLEDMRIPSYASYHMIRDAALSLGLQLCTAEMVMQLRRDYLDQPVGPSLYFPVKSFISDSDAYIFSLMSDGSGTLWTDCEDGTEESLCSYVDSAVFVKPRAK